MQLATLHCSELNEIVKAADVSKIMLKVSV